MIYQVSTQLKVNEIFAKITIQAAKLRFTQQERIAIRSASKENGYVEDFMDILNSGSHVDLLRKDFKEGLSFLVSMGIRTEQRMDEILRSPIQDHEVFKG